MAARQRPPGPHHSWVAPPLCTLKQLHGDLLQQYNCTEQPPAQLLPQSAGGNASFNAGVRPQPPAGSQDNSNVKLLLPQLNRLHEAFKRRQVSPSASSISQDQQSQQALRSPSSLPSLVSRSSSPRHWATIQGPASALRRHALRGALTASPAIRSTRPQSQDSTLRGGDAQLVRGASRQGQGQ